MLPCRMQVNMKDFVVVEFLNEQSVETIPAAWLSPTKRNAGWPDIKNYAKMKKALQGQFDFSQGKWTQAPVRILAEADSYNIAKKKEKRSIYTSSIDTTDTEHVPKRKHVEYESETDEFLENLVIPDFPKSKNMISSHSKKTTEELLRSDDELHLSSGSLNNERVPLKVRKMKQCSSSTRNKAQEVFQTKVLKTIEDLAYEVKTVKKIVLNLELQLKSVQERERKEDTVDSFAIEYLPFPIQNEEDLRIVEQYAAAPEIAAKMVLQLAKIGGTTYVDVTYNVMNKVFGSPFSRLYSLHGKKGKLAFKQLYIYSVVIRAVQNKCTAVTEVEIQQRIIAFLSGAGDRYGGRKLRAEAKKSHPSEESESLLGEDE